MLELISISSGYGRDAVLSELFLELRPHELLSVVGVNGCGKSTLLRTAAGLIRPTSGEVLLDGISLSSLSRIDAARGVAYLPQSSDIPDMTVEQLVLLGRFPHLGYPRIYRRSDRALALSAIEKMGLTEHSERKLSVLSGGTRQKAFIAMALCQDARYILLDEPTAHLDISSQVELFSLLRSLSREGDGRGIAVVTHDLPLCMSLSDRVAVLDGRRLVSVGTPDELFTSGVLTDIFGVSLSRGTDGGYYYTYSQR